MTPRPLSLLYAPSPAAAPVVLRPRPALAPTPEVLRALVAVLLCSSLESRRDARIVRILHEAAALTLDALTVRYALTSAHRHAAIARASSLWDVIVAQPDADRVPVTVALVRRLLEDAPDCCEAVDRAVRDAAAGHGWPITAEHERTAERVVAA